MAGRPSTYTKEIGIEICNSIASSSKSMKTICEEVGVPLRTVLEWLNNTPDFLQLYAMAKEQQADYLAEEMIEIADDGSNDFMTITKGDLTYNVEDREVTNRSRLRVDTRKWIASKLKPKKYADRVDLTTNGKDLPGSNIINLPTDALKQLEQIIANATTTDNKTDVTGNPEGTV